jgi:hypothetical protein
MWPSVSTLSPMRTPRRCSKRSKERPCYAATAAPTRRSAAFLRLVQTHHSRLRSSC